MIPFIFRDETCWNLVAMFSKANCKSTRNLKPNKLYFMWNLVVWISWITGKLK